MCVNNSFSPFVQLYPLVFPLIGFKVTDNIVFIEPYGALGQVFSRYAADVLSHNIFKNTTELDEKSMIL